MGSNIYAPGPTAETAISAEGRVVNVPPGWRHLPPGDAALTRRVKEAGEFWLLQQKRGRKIFSLGLWAPAATIDRIQADLAAERSTAAYAKRREYGVKRRERVQTEYVEDFTAAVKEFLAFHPRHEQLAEQLARAVAAHATPVGSGTVARTQRIPVEQRAEAAVIAWMRHQTTSYDSLEISRAAGERREVRRMLAERSRALLQRYRAGEPASSQCPLQRALDGLDPLELDE